MKVSIITVCLNSEKTVDETIKSVLSQTYDDVEHIIVDGGSTDNTVNIVESYKAANHKFISEPDDGIYYGMNRGIAMSSGEVIGFLNSDDVFFDDFSLEKIVRKFEASDSTQIVFGDLWVMNPGLTKKKRVIKAKRFIPGYFGRGLCPPHPSFYCRRGVFEVAGDFDTSFSIAADVEFMMRCLEVLKLKSLVINRPLIKMRSGGASDAGFSGLKTQNFEVLKAMQKHKLDVCLFTFVFGKILDRIHQRFTAYVSN